MTLCANESDGESKRGHGLASLDSTCAGLVERRRQAQGRFRRFGMQGPAAANTAAPRMTCKKLRGREALTSRRSSGDARQDDLGRNTQLLGPESSPVVGLEQEGAPWIESVCAENSFVSLARD